MALNNAMDMIKGILLWTTLIKWRKDATENHSQVMHILVVFFFLNCTLLLSAPEYDPFPLVQVEGYEVISTLVGC
jgi:hypothetical protein